MTDPYKTLHVKRAATAEQITRAYRKLAKRHHPDHNPGDDSAAARFDAIDRAYQLLIDPARRVHFDRTGDTDAPRAANPLAEVMPVVSTFLFGVVESILKQGGDVASEDVVKHMRDVMGRNEAELRKARAALARTRAALEVAVARFVTKRAGADGENLLASAAKAHLARVGAAIGRNEAEEARVRRAREFLDDYGYTVDVKAMSTGGWGYYSA